MNFERCFNLAIEMNNARLQLDCLICLGYITFNMEEWEKSKDYFEKAYFVAKGIKEIVIAEQCLCNSGIASGNLELGK